jgi:hypothetical protein
MKTTEQIKKGDNYKNRKWVEWTSLDEVKKFFDLLKETKEEYKKEENKKKEDKEEEQNLIIDYFGKKIEISKWKPCIEKLEELKIPEGWKLLTFDMFDFLVYNYLDKFNPEKKKTIIKNIEYNYKVGRSHIITGFSAGSGAVWFLCGEYPVDSYSCLGVIFWREVRDGTYKSKIGWKI